MSSEIRTCRKCGLEKPLECFRKNSKGKGRGHCCRGCRTKTHKVWVAQSPEKRRAAPEKRAAYARKAKYGITNAEYQALAIKQQGLCAICGGPPTKKRLSLAVDHCHSTGIIRGLLCDLCNRGLGQFKDSIELLEKALRYLRS